MPHALKKCYALIKHVYLKKTKKNKKKEKYNTF